MAEQENTSPSPSATLGTPGTGATPNASSSATQQGAAPTLEEALRKLADLEHSSKNASEEVERHRKKLTAYEKAEKEREAAAQAVKDAELGEVERTKKQLSDLQAKYDAETEKYKQELISTKVQLSAKEKGIIDTELAAMAIQKSLEFGDDGMPTNIDKALDTLIKSKPYLAPKQQEPTQELPASPAQTANPQRPPAPQTPPMNPGRSQISPPSAPPQQGPYRPPSWNDVYTKS
jgi:hypothetical protein